VVSGLVIISIGVLLRSSRVPEEKERGKQQAEKKKYKKIQKKKMEINRMLSLFFGLIFRGVLFLRDDDNFHSQKCIR